MLSLHEIDARIEKLSEEIRALRALRNQQPGLCRLPHELLQVILQHNSGIWTSWKDLIRIACVCQRLRYSALGMPRLWATIPEALTLFKATKPIFDVYLARSGDAPLSICAPSGENGPHLMGAIRNNLNRIQFLYFTLKYGTHWEQSKAFMDHLHTHPAPLMLELTLGEDGLPESSVNSANRRGHCISSSLLGGVCLHLTTLELNGVGLEGVPAMPRLTSLTLSHTRSSMEQLHRALACLATLQHLNLDPAPTKWDEATEYTPITMPDLRTLYIGEDARTVACMFSFLPDPSETLKVFLDGKGDRDGLQRWSMFLLENEVIMARLSSWWESNTGHTDLPAVSISSEYTHLDRSAASLKDLLDSGDPEIPDAVHQMEFTECWESDNEDRSVTICFISTIDSVEDRDPFLLRVLDLCVHLDDCHDSIDVRNDISLDALTAVTHLTINRSRDSFHMNRHWRAAPSLRGLVDWAISRRIEGTPLECITFKQCDESLRPMFSHLQDEKLAEELIWETGGRY
jgi:hypothetical protein